MSDPENNNGQQDQKDNIYPTLFQVSEKTLLFNALM